MRYTAHGTIRITRSWAIVNETIEGDSEEDAIDGLIEDLNSEDAFEYDADTYGLTVEPIPDPEEPSEAARMRAMGQPVLPGFDWPPHARGAGLRIGVVCVPHAARPNPVGEDVIRRMAGRR